MMNFDGQEVGGEFQESFGREISTINERQMWWLLKFAKHVRGRCRSNAALMNYLNRNFKHLRFEEVKEPGAEYPTTKITERVV